MAKQRKITASVGFFVLRHTAIKVRRVDRHHASDKALKLNVREYKSPEKSVTTTKNLATLLNLTSRFKARPSSRKLPTAK